MPTLYGPAKLKVPAGIQTGKVIRLKGKGMPLVNRPSTFGDEWVEIKVVTPEKLSKRQKQLLEELGKSLGTPDDSAKTEGLRSSKADSIWNAASGAAARG